MDLGPGMAAGKAHLLDDVIGAPHQAAPASSLLSSLAPLPARSCASNPGSCRVKGRKPAPCTAVAFHAVSRYIGHGASAVALPCFCLQISTYSGTSVMSGSRCKVDVFNCSSYVQTTLRCAPTTTRGARSLSPSASATRCWPRSWTPSRAASGNCRSKQGMRDRQM